MVFQLGQITAPVCSSASSRALRGSLRDRQQSTLLAARSAEPRFRQLISDTGGGIPADIQDQIFDPFFTTKELGRGTGQDLAIACLVIVDKHAGSLTFATTPGHGTTFHIRLPLAAAQAAA